MTDDLFSKLLVPDGAPPTWQELADALWLARHLPPPSESIPDGSAPKRSANGAGARLEPATEAIALREQRATPESSTSLGRDAAPPLPPRRRLTLADGGEPDEGATRVRLPMPPALPGALALHRALRPLGRRAVPDGGHALAQLDEEATVELTAASGFRLPVLRPAPTRWLDVALVVDDSVSMGVWDRSVREFRALLQTAGTFRSVQDWTLLSEETHFRGVVLRRGIPTALAAIDRSPRELVDPTGRRIILVVSDCIGPAWSDGSMAQLLRMWGRCGPVAIVQPLPRRMWERIRMGVHDLKLSSSVPGAANVSLAARTRRGAGTPVVGMPVPLLILDTRSLGPWAALTSGESPEFHTLAILVDGPAPPDESPDSSDEPEPSLDDLVEQFRERASREAFKLAVYLTAVPLNQPVMRMVQQGMLSDPQPSQIAEVMLSGLLVRARPDSEARGDDIVFDFRPGVREQLMGGLTRQAARRLLQITTEYIDEHLGSTIDFPALLRGDDLAVAQLAQHEPFAEASARILRLLDVRPPTAQSPEASADPARIPDARPQEAPSIRGTPPPRAADLFGRERLLKELHEALASDTAAPQVLVAPDGGGATAVAVEYVHTHGADYEFVLWMPAGSPMVGGAELARLRSVGAIRPDEGMPPSWLLVLDGAAPGDGLPQLPAGRGHVLVTSTDPDWPEGITVHTVPAVRRGTAIRIARRHNPSLAAPAAQRLAERLDDVPLALEIAATFLAVTGEAPDAYVERFGALLPDPAASDPAAAACGLALDHVLDELPQASGILHRLAVLAPGPVPLQLLANDMPRAGRTADPVLRELLRHALLSTGGWTTRT